MSSTTTKHLNTYQNNSTLTTQNTHCVRHTFC